MGVNKEATLINWELIRQHFADQIALPPDKTRTPFVDTLQTSPIAPPKILIGSFLQIRFLCRDPI